MDGVFLTVQKMNYNLEIYICIFLLVLLVVQVYNMHQKG